MDFGTFRIFRFPRAQLFKLIFSFIAWYINGLLIPEIYVVRGKTYTFVIEGGNDPNQPAAYHPFYITDDKEGGYQYKKPNQRRNVRVFAGIENNRLAGDTPTGIGRLCEWREDPQSPAETFNSFGAYQVSHLQISIFYLNILQINLLS